MSLKESIVLDNVVSSAYMIIIKLVLCYLKVVRSYVQLCQILV